MCTKMGILIRQVCTKMDIKGKVALVTGGAAGIGKSCCTELLKNGLKGIVMADINENGCTEEANLNKTFGDGRAMFIRTDVTDANQFEAAFKQAKSTFGGLDIVINNAGILNDANWQLEIAINVSAVVQGSLFGLKYMGKNNGGNGGVVVNISSILGLQALAGRPVYTGTKHFIIGFDRSLGTDSFFDLTGVRFLTMCPGVTESRMVKEASKNTFRDFPSLEQFLESWVGSVPAQAADFVGKGVVAIITTAENGSIWVSEGAEPIYEVTIPDRQTFRKK